jgi:hypothetical protein
MKQHSLLGNRFFNKQERTTGFRDRLEKHVPAATDTHATIQELLETFFFNAVSANGLYNENSFTQSITASVQLENEKLWLWASRGLSPGQTDWR